MWKVFVLVFILCLSYRNIDAQVEHFIGLPSEIDFDLADNWNSPPENHEIWDDTPDTEIERSPMQILASLCSQFDLLLDNKIIDCTELKLVPKTLILAKVRQRREVSEQELEGSGEEPPVEEISKEKSEQNEEVEIAVSTLESTKTPYVEDDKKEFSENALNSGFPVPEESILKEKVTQMNLDTDKNSLNVQPINGEEKVVKEPINVDLSLAEPTLEQANNIDVTHEEPKKVEPSLEQANSVDVTHEEPKKEEPSLEQPNNVDVTHEEPKKVEPSPEQANNVDVTHEEPKKEESSLEQANNVNAAHAERNEKTVTLDTPKGEQAPKEEKVIPETPNKEEVATEGKLELIDAGKDHESNAKKGRILVKEEEINSQQSGNAIIPIEGPGGSIADDDKKINNMKPKESLRAILGGIGEEPKTGQSSEDGGRKDNKLLITLFVAVLVIGAAAFAYNYIKKRKNRNAARQGANGSVPNDDPEQGKEMKPLMTEGENKRE